MQKPLPICFAFMYKQKGGRSPLSLRFRGRVSPGLFLSLLDIRGGCLRRWTRSPRPSSLQSAAIFGRSDDALGVLRGTAKRGAEGGDDALGMSVHVNTLREPLGMSRRSHVYI